MGVAVFSNILANNEDLGIVKWDIEIWQKQLISWRFHADSGRWLVEFIVVLQYILLLEGCLNVLEGFFGWNYTLDKVNKTVSFVFVFFVPSLNLRRWASLQYKI